MWCRSSILLMRGAGLAGGLGCRDFSIPSSNLSCTDDILNRTEAPRAEALPPRALIFWSVSIPTSNPDARRARHILPHRSSQFARPPVLQPTQPIACVVPHSTFAHRHVAIPAGGANWLALQPNLFAFQQLGKHRGSCWGWVRADAPPRSCTVGNAGRCG